MVARKHAAPTPTPPSGPHPLRPPATLPEGPEAGLPTSAAWRAGYEQGVKDAVKRVKDEMRKPVPAAASPQPEIETDMLRMLLQIRQPPTGETPAQRSARKRRMERMMRDETQALEFAILIREGHTTEQAAQKMKLGVVRSQRIRALAVKLRLLAPRQRGPGTP